MVASSFSVHLTDAAKLHLSFLQDAHREGITLTPVTKKSLDRYVNIWLPVVVRSFSFLSGITVVYYCCCFRPRR
jgi:hypothetical protein